MTFAAIKNLTLVFFVLVVAISCRKGDLPEVHYLGKVHVDLMNLPNTPTVMMYFNGKQLDTINPNGGTSFDLAAGEKGKLSAFDAHSKEWLADTIIAIEPNGKQQLKFAYSTLFGLKGFVAGGNSATVPTDSIDVRWFNNLNPTFYPLEVYDLSFLYLDPVSGGIVPSDVVVKGWRRKQLSPALRMKVVADNGAAYTYIAQLRDPATGEVVPQPDDAMFFVSITADNPGGKTRITTVNDDATGTISVNEIDL